MLTLFCPKCWREVQEPEVNCGGCDFPLSEYTGLSYEEKLLLALKHPLQEHRMIAIRLLGDLRSDRAVPVFESMLGADEDFYTVRAVLRSLRKIGSPASVEIISRLRHHPSRLVRRVAEAG